MTASAVGTPLIAARTTCDACGPWRGAPARRAAGPQTTTLVHEAYLRLVGFDSDDWNDRR